MTDSLLFLRAWMGAPLRVASVLPSGAGLADLITADIDHSTGPVLELGPGTGVFTRRLLQRGVAESDLTLIEAGAEFIDLLKRRYPHAAIHVMDATRLHRLLPGLQARHGAAVSGLPLLSMPRAQVFSILRGSFLLMRPGASLYQFTYGLRCPVPQSVLARLGLCARHRGHTFRNVPPASVWQISREGNHAA